MPRRRLMLLALLCGLIGPMSDLEQTGAQPPAGVEGLRLGMTSNQVRDLLGPPTNVSRRIILYRTHEQWHYAKQGLRLSFDHPRGASAVLVRISARDRGD
jgi:hypothetical protein